MLQDKSDFGVEEAPLTAFVSESKDREGNSFFIAEICDNEQDAIIKELSDYDREELEKEVLKQYPDIPIENG